MSTVFSHWGVLAMMSGPPSEEPAWMGIEHRGERQVVVMGGHPAESMVWADKVCLAAVGACLAGLDAWARALRGGAP